jgi:membrane dipeptidase
VTVATATTYGRFDFGLSSEQEERARRLHRSSVIVDLHWQGPCSPDVWSDALVAELDQRLADRVDDWDLVRDFLTDKALQGEFPLYRDLYVESGATAVMIDGALKDERQLLADAFRASRHASGFPWARRARTAGDIRAAKSADQVAFWGMAAFNLLRPEDLRLVEIAHELGTMDVVELAYNRMNFIGAGCTERHDPGLSEFGRQFVARCNEVGVIVDTSHSGLGTTLDACRTSRQPVVATHTGAAALYPHARAKTDDVLRAIADTGGVIGVFAVPFMLSPASGKPPTIELMLDHLDHIAALVGWRHLAIGTDWPMTGPLAVQRRLLPPRFERNGFRNEHNIDITARLDGYRDPRDLLNITRGLVSRGYEDKQIRGILGENFLRVFETVCG